MLLPLIWAALVPLGGSASIGYAEPGALTFQSSDGPGFSPFFQDTTARTRNRWFTPRAPSDSLRTIPELPEQGYRLEPITVIGLRREITRTISPISVSIDDNGSSNATVQAIRRLPAVFLRSYGGAGSVHSLSTNGGAAAHTTVLLDGITLNSPQNGELDLALIPLGLIGTIEYLPHGGFAAHGSTGLSGVVNLTPVEKATRVAYTTGSYGWRELQAALSKGMPLSLSIGTTSYTGDFPYSFRDKRYRRRNNEFQQRSMQLSSQWRRQDLGGYKFQTWLVENRRGVPGQIWSPNPDSRQWDRWYLLSAARSWRGANNHYRLRLYRHASHERYSDPRLNIASRHQLAISGLQYERTRVPATWISGFRLWELRNEILHSTDAKDHEQWRLDITEQMLLKPVAGISILPVGRLSARSNAALVATGDIAFQFRPGENEGILESVTVLAGKNYRYPTFNDLYWEPGGNPDLNPETALTGGIKTGWRLGHRNRLALNAIHMRYENLIIWSPDQDGLWRPDNISVASSTSLTAQAELYLLKERVRIELGWDEVITRDLMPGAHYGKSLRFAPRHALKIMAETVSPAGWRLRCQASATSAYLTAYDYPQDKTQPPIVTCDAQLYRRLALRQVAVSLTLGVNNIMNHHYAIIPGYPEPGRSINLTIDLSRNANND